MKLFKYLLVVALAAIFTACPSKVATPNEIGIVGGIVKTDNNAVLLEFPANAVSQNTVIGIAPATTGLPTEDVLAGTAHNLTPENLVLATPTKIKVGFDPSALPTGVSPSDLFLMQRNTAGQWVELPSSLQASNDQTLTTQAPNSAYLYSRIDRINAIFVGYRYGTTLSFTATPQTISGSSQITLNWSVDNGIFVYSNTTQSIDNGIGAVAATGSRVVTVSSSTTFILTAKRGKSSLTKSVTVTVSPVATGFTVTASAGANGTVNPTTQSVANGATANVTVTPNAGFRIDTVTGCGGTLAGNTYTTGAITASCTVNATFLAAIATTGTTNFDVTGQGTLQTARTSSYRVAGVTAPVNGRPLVIYLHGDGATNIQVSSLTSYSDWTDQEAAVLVAPQGRGGTWRFRMDGKNDAGTSAEVDDIAFIKEIITRGSNAANPLFGAGNKIDPSKVFVVGESRGGGMAYYLYAHPDTKNLITAIAPVSGTFYCSTSNGGNGSTPYTPPATSDFTCGENGGFGYFSPKASLYTRISAPRILAIHSTNDLQETAAPELDNEYGNLILMTKLWAKNSDNCGLVLPSANPLFDVLFSGVNKVVKGYRQRNAANTAPCAADVTFYIVNEGGHVPSGFQERITKWFFGQYSTLTNTFN